MRALESNTKIGHLDQLFKEKKIRNGAIPTKKEKWRMNLSKPIILDLIKVLVQEFQNSYIKIDMVINYPKVSKYYNNASRFLCGTMGAK